MASKLMQQIETRKNILSFKGISLLMKKILSILTCLSFTLSAFANTSSNTNQTGWWSPSRLHIGAYGGYGNIKGADKQDGQVAQGRLALGLHAAEYKCLSFGTEIGVQSGNTMRLDANSTIITVTGGLPIQSTLKPLLDILITVKGQLLPNYPLFALLKGGVAYRQLVLNDRSSSQDGLKKVNGELQAGLALNLTDHATLTASYQGIYSDANAGVNLNTVGNVTINRIPTQQAGFLGFEYSV